MKVRSAMCVGVGLLSLVIGMMQTLTPSGGLISLLLHAVSGVALVRLGYFAPLRVVRRLTGVAGAGFVLIGGLAFSGQTLDLTGLDHVFFGAAGMMLVFASVASPSRTITREIIELPILRSCKVGPLRRLP